MNFGLQNFESFDGIIHLQMFSSYQRIETQIQIIISSD
jgi:hypothetical protein